MVEAADAREALALLGEHTGPIHLFLTDVIMPQMGGRELAQRAVVLRPDIRVLYMSGYTDSEILPGGLVTDELAFLHKPFTPDILLARVREVLDSPT